jgi:hypothetical protein
MMFALTFVLMTAVAPLFAADHAATIKMEPVLPGQQVQTPVLQGQTGDFEVPLGPSTLTDSLKWVTGDIFVSSFVDQEVKPAIAHAPNGDLFVVTEDLTSVSLLAYISTNGGGTWTLQKNFGSSPDSRNPSIAVVEEGDGQRWVFVAYEVVLSDISRRARLYKYDPDNPGAGGTFISIVDSIAWTQPTQQLYPRLVTDNINYSNSYYLYVTYAIPSIDYYPVFFVRSTDQGATFQTPVNVTGGSANTGATSRPAIAWGHGNLYIAFTKPGYNGSTLTRQVYVTRSANYSWGGTWDTPVQLTASTYDRDLPAVAAAQGTDSVVVGYTAEHATESRIDGVSSTNAGDTWGSEFSFPYVPNVDETGVALAASRGTPGRFHAVFWRDYDLRYTSSDVTSPQSFGSTVLVNSENSASLDYPIPAITVNPSEAITEEAAIVWTDFRGGLYDVYFNGPVAEVIFSDGFESGNMTAWSSSVP